MDEELLVERCGRLRDVVVEETGGRMTGGLWITSGNIDWGMRGRI